MTALLYYELLAILRDRRTLLLSILLPVLLLPLMVTGLQRFTQHLDRQASPDVYKIVIEGPQAPVLRRLVEKYSAVDPKAPVFREVGASNEPTLSRLRTGGIDLAVEVSIPVAGSPEDAAKVTGDRGGFEGRLFRERQPGRPLVRVMYAADLDRSLTARNHYTETLRDVIGQYRDSVLEEKAISSGEFLAATMVDTADTPTRNRSWVASFFPIILLALLVSGASVAAVDSLAGERERGTWETLLTSCLSRVEIVAAKQITVALVALVVCTTQLLNLLFNWRMGWLKLPEGFNLDFPLAGLVVTAALALIQTNLVSSILLYASARSQSFKEAQLLFFPLFVTCLALGSASLFPDLGPNSLIVLVPISGLNVVMRQALLGHVELPFVALTGVVNVAASIWFSRACLQRLLTQGEGNLVDGGDVEEQKRLNLREQISWVYALMAAAILIVPGNLPMLTDLIGQVVFNQGMMLGVCALLCWHHSIDPRRALRLKAVPVLVWPLALLLGPLLQMCANSLVIATQALLPIPDEMTQEMNRMLLPDNLSLPVLVGLLAVAPAICEEIGFRGLFMYAFLPPPGSRSWSAKCKCAALVGLVFGLFHLSIYRFLPTAVVGAVLAMLALQCGSILPGMLVHCGNNGLAVVFEKNDVDLTSLPGWLLFGAWPFSLGLLVLIGKLCKRAA